MVYLLWESFSVILNKKNIRKSQLLLLLVFFLWLFMSIRSITMGVFDVTGVYYPIFMKSKSISLISLLSERGIMNEPLMYIIIWLFSRLFESFRFFLSMMSLVSLFSIYRFIIKNSKGLIESILIYFSFFYFYQAFLIKQMLALALILLAYNSLFKRNFIRYILLVILAGFIHKSSFVLIPMYFLCDNLKFNKNFFVFALLGMCLAIFGKDIILNLLYKFSFYRFDVYLRNGIYGLDGTINFSMFLYMFLTFASYSVLKEQLTRELNDYFIIVIIGCVLNTWSIVVVEFYRFSIYFLIIMCVLIPEAFNATKTKYKKLIYVIFLIFICIYAFKTAYNCNCLPYRTFLFDKELL